MTSPSTVWISPGWAGRYCLRKSVKRRSPMKQMPVESFFFAVARPYFSAIARTAGFSSSPTGNRVRAICSPPTACRK
ncbi:hypothetical protein D3C84_1142620 [compost metagenome]